MKVFRHCVWLLCLLLVTPSVLRAQLLARHYQARLAFAGDRMQAQVTVRVHTERPTRVVTFWLDRSLRMGDVAIEGQTYRAAMLSPGHYTLLMVSPWVGNTDHWVTFQYAGTPPAPDVVVPGEVLLSPDSGWYPTFRHRAPFTTEVDLRVPAGIQVMTRGQLTQEDSAGGQKWEDGQAGTSLGLVWKRGLSQTEMDWPGLQMQAVCPTLPADACAARATTFGHGLAAYYGQLSRWFGQPSRSRIIPVVLAPGVETLEGGPSLYFAPLPEAATATTREQLELANSLSRLWWNFSELAPADRWLSLGLPAMTALALVRQEQGATAETAALKWFQESARKDGAALAGRSQSATSEATGSSGASAEAARAALVLNALRMQVGPEPFWRVLTAANRLGWRRSAAITTDEFKRIAARLTHNQLDWFWQQWLERPDLPQIQFSWRRVRLPRSGQTVRVEVEQKGFAFGFRAPIVIVAGGHRYFQFIEVHNRNTILGIPVRGRIDSVEFDPGFQLLRASLAAPPAGFAGGCPPSAQEARKRGRRIPRSPRGQNPTSLPPGCSSR